MIWLLLAACTQDAAQDSDTGKSVAWSASRPRLDHAIGEARWYRTIVHLHSPFSHDACDGEGWSEAEGVDLACLADLRVGLCNNGIDAAFLTDHPSHAAEQPFLDMRHLEEGDRDLGAGAGWACADGTETAVWPGFEDELMPVGLSEPLEDTALYSSGSPEAIASLNAAGAIVLSAHPEGRSREQLLERQAAGAAGFEIFNLHAMFAPDIRSEDLGLDAWSWTSDIAPFTNPNASAEPDLFFLAVHGDQAPSLEHFDALSQLAHTVGVAGTDAHQNVLNMELRDGERADSYRRMLSWFSNWVVAESAQDIQSGLGGGNVAVVFESLGTPASLELLLSGQPPGNSVSTGTLQLPCLALAPTSPRGEEDPVIEAFVLKDGQPFAQGCGTHEITEPGVYRVRYSITPWHLEPFLGEDPAPYLREYTWILSNPWWVQ